MIWPLMITSLSTPSTVLSGSVSLANPTFSGRIMSVTRAPGSTLVPGASRRVRPSPVVRATSPSPVPATVAESRLDSPRKSGREYRGGPEVEIGGRADLLDTRVVHQADAVRHHHRFLLVVGHVQHGDAEVFVQMLDLALQGVAQLLVECAERLVHQDDGGLVDETARERDAAAAVRPKARAASESSTPGSRTVSSTRRTAARTAASPCRRNAQRERDVFVDGHVGKQGIVLKDHPDGRARRAAGRSRACRRSRSRPGRGR